VTWPPEEEPVVTAEQRRAADDSRSGPPQAEVFAEPRTAESYIINAGIHDREALDAVLSRPVKSEGLLHALIQVIGTAPWVPPLDTYPLMNVLLSDPAVSAGNLELMASWSLRYATGETPDALRLAVCVHPAAEMATLVAALWGPPERVPQAVGRAVAAATSSLVPAAVCWVCRYSRRAACTPSSLTKVEALVARWEAQCAGDRALVAFVASRGFDYTDEVDMFAVGRALSAAPAATARQSTTGS